MWFLKKKNKYPEQAKYQKGDYVNFRYHGDLHFGYINEAKLDQDNKVLYRIQIAGQCPSYVNDYKEENIIGLKTK